MSFFGGGVFIGSAGLQNSQSILAVQLQTNLKLKQPTCYSLEHFEDCHGRGCFLSNFFPVDLFDSFDFHSLADWRHSVDYHILAGIGVGFVLAHMAIAPFVPFDFVTISIDDSSRAVQHRRVFRFFWAVDVSAVKFLHLYDCSRFE